MGPLLPRLWLAAAAELSRLCSQVCEGRRRRAGEGGGTAAGAGRWQSLHAWGGGWQQPLTSPEANSRGVSRGMEAPD